MKWQSRFLSVQNRVTIGGKTSKPAVLPWFCKIECGRGSVPPCYGVLPRRWRPCKAHKSHRAVSNAVEGFEEKVRSVAFPLWRLSHNTSTALPAAAARRRASGEAKAILALQESRYKSPLLCWPRLICIQTRPVRYLAAKTIAKWV